MENKGYVAKINEDIILKALSVGVKNMPTNPASRGYSQEQIRAFYYKTEEEILRLLQKVEGGVVEDSKAIWEAINEVVEKLPSDYNDLKESIRLLGEAVDNHYDNVEHEIKVLREVDDEILTRIENLENNGVDLTDYQKKTDDTLETTNKTIVGAINEVNAKVGQGGSGGGSSVDLTDYVKNTDIATKDKAGVLKIYGTSAYPEGIGLVINDKGAIGLRKLTSVQLRDRNLPLLKTFSQRTALTIYNADLAVKYALTGDNTSLTDTDKESIKSWLGVNSKHTHLLTIYSLNMQSIIIIKFEHPKATRLTFEELSGDMTVYMHGLSIFAEDTGFWYIIEKFSGGEFVLWNLENNQVSETLCETQEEAEELPGAYIYSYSVV